MDKILQKTLGVLIIIFTLASGAAIIGGMAAVIVFLKILVEAVIILYFIAIGLVLIIG